MENENPLSNPPALPEGDRWLGEAEAGEVTGLGHRRLQSRRLYGGGSMPAHYNLRPGILYRLSECVAWREAGRVEPGDPSPASTTPITTPGPAPTDT